MLNAKHVATLSTCKKRKVGCIVYRNNEILSYGFNHGLDEKCSCSMSSKNPDVLHAEEMALSHDIDFTDAILEVTYAPCINCAKLIVSKGIKEVIYHDADKCGSGIKYLINHNVSVINNEST